MSKCKNDRIDVSLNEKTLYVDCRAEKSFWLFNFHILFRKIDDLICSFNFRYCENRWFDMHVSFSILRKLMIWLTRSFFDIKKIDEMMMIFQFFFVRSSSISWLKNVWKSSFHFVIQFRFKFFQSFFERKKRTKNFYVFDRVNDNVRVRINLYYFVFEHSFEIWSWIIFRECWIENYYFKKFFKYLFKKRKFRILKFRKRFRCAIAKLW